MYNDAAVVNIHTIHKLFFPRDCCLARLHSAALDVGLVVCLSRSCIVSKRLKDTTTVALKCEYETVSKPHFAAYAYMFRNFKMENTTTRYFFSKIIRQNYLTLGTSGLSWWTYSTIVEIYLRR